MANEEISSTLTMMGERVEKILHIHQTSLAREDDISTKLTMFWLLVTEVLFLLPITPIGKVFWSWCTAGIKFSGIVTTIAIVALLFKNLHPEADCGEFYDEDGYDNVKEDAA